jgi:hypothetical protein
LELLKEVAPGVNRVLVLVNSGSDANLIISRTIGGCAASFGVQVSSGVVRDAIEIESAIEGIAPLPYQGDAKNPAYAPVTPRDDTLARRSGVIRGRRGLLRPRH